VGSAGRGVRVGIPPGTSPRMGAAVLPARASRAAVGRSEAAASAASTGPCSSRCPQRCPDAMAKPAEETPYFIKNKLVFFRSFGRKGEYKVSLFAGFSQEENGSCLL